MSVFWLSHFSCRYYCVGCRWLWAADPPPIMAFRWRHYRSVWLSLLSEFPVRMRSNLVYSNRPFLRRLAMWAMPVGDTWLRLWYRTHARSFIELSRFVYGLISAEGLSVTRRRYARRRRLTLTYFFLAKQSICECHWDLFYLFSILYECSEWLNDLSSDVDQVYAVPQSSLLSCKVHLISLNMIVVLIHIYLTGIESMNCGWNENGFLTLFNFFFICIQKNIDENIFVSRALLFSNIIEIQKDSNSSKAK